MTRPSHSARIWFCALAICFAAQHTFAQCGTERWPIKTLTDPDTTRINWTALGTTVYNQGTLTRTIQHWLSAPRQKDEEQLYTLECYITGYGKETDGDIHLVIQEVNSSAHMIAEVPDSACAEVAATSHAGTYAMVRSLLAGKFGKATSTIKQVTPTKVVLQGIGFWDELNHGTGHAPNGREIHPVVSIAFE